MHLKNPLTLAIITLTLTACAWVKPTPEGEKIQVLTATEVTDCIDMGRTTASLKDRVAGIKRSENKVKWELITLARNSAANMDGDTIAPSPRSAKAARPSASTSAWAPAPRTTASPPFPNLATSPRPDPSPLIAFSYWHHQNNQFEQSTSSA